MIGKLQYVVHSRPNIALVFGIVARFFANQKDNHMMVVKRIMRQLIGTTKYGLYYKKNKDFELKAYTNADWACSLDDIKSTSRGAFFLGSRLVSWTSKKKKYISKYIVEATSKFHPIFRQGFIEILTSIGPHSDDYHWSFSVKILTLYPFHQKIDDMIIEMF